MKRFLCPIVPLVVLLVAGCQKSSETVPAGVSDSAAAAVSAKPYPLEKCVVSDEKLGSMGEPVVFVHNGQQIKLCCKDCRKDFDKDPAKYLAKLAK